MLSPLTSGKAASKDSIRDAKNWIISQTPYANQIAELIKSRFVSFYRVFLPFAYVILRIELLPDFTQKLNLIYLINDVLHHSSHKRVEEGGPMDEFSLAFQVFVFLMLW